MTPEKIERVMELVELFGVENWKCGIWHKTEKMVEEHGADADKILAEIRAALTAESEGNSTNGT